MSPERQSSGTPAPPTGSKTDTIPFDQQVLLRLEQLEVISKLALVRAMGLVAPLLKLIKETQEIRDQVREREMVIFDGVKKHGKEEEALPLLYINKKEGWAEINGKVLQFGKKDTLTFRLLVFLAENPGRPIKTREIKEKVFPKINYATVANFRLGILRKIIGDDRNERQIIVHTGKSKKSFYALNARVEVIGGDPYFPKLPEAKKTKGTNLKLRQPGAESKIPQAIGGDGHDPCHKSRVASRRQISGNNTHKEEIPSPKEMILTDDEVRTLAWLILNNNKRWIWGRAGVAFPEDVELDIGKISTALHDGWEIKDNILNSLRTKMELLGKHREAFTEQNQGREAATLLIQCVLRVDSSKWQDFVGTLIPAKLAFIN